MTINEMKNNVIRTYGFEHPATIYFFERCEDTADDPCLLDVCYYVAMTAGFWKEEE